MPITLSSHKVITSFSCGLYVRVYFCIVLAVIFSLFVLFKLYDLTAACSFPMAQWVLFWFLNHCRNDFATVYIHSNLFLSSCAHQVSVPILLHIDLFLAY